MPWPSMMTARVALKAPAPVDHVPYFLPRRSPMDFTALSFLTNTSCITVSPPPTMTKSSPLVILAMAAVPAYDEQGTSLAGSAAMCPLKGRTSTSASMPFFSKIPAISPAR